MRIDILPLYGHCTYALYGECGELLYIGVSSSVLYRIGQHVKNHADRIHGFQVLTRHRGPYGRDHAVWQETRLIKALRPPWNIRHVEKAA